MEPAHLRFGGGATESILHPLVALWLLTVVVLIFVLPRRKVITYFLLSCFCVPVGQVVVIGGLHFTVLRLLIIAGLLKRAMARGSSSSIRFAGGFNSVDQVTVLWTISSLIVVSVQWMDVQALIHNLGDFLDALGGFLVLRFLISDRESMKRTISVLAVIFTILGVCMINEQMTHVNIFGYLGGTSVAVTVRDGKIRSEGVMGCLYGGAFAGASVPLFLWLWRESKLKTTAFAGLVGSMAMVITSQSSTSWLALAGSFLGLSFWFLRRQMRLVRWAFSVGLVALHMVMKAPVWALIARVDLTGSSSGDHRYKLVDNCIRHFSDWWLLGYKYYNDWGWDMWDLCNQFVVAALTGGLVTLICYIAMFSRSFSAIGKARKQVNGNRRQEWLLWCLGSDLFANVVAHFGINYMAQMMMTMFMLIACISVATFESMPVARRASLEAESVDWLKAENVSWPEVSVPEKYVLSGLRRGNE